MNATRHVVEIEDEDTDDGEVSRWACTCGRHGHWTPTRERQLVVIRGDAHKLRFRKKRPPRGRTGIDQLKDTLRLTW